MERLLGELHATKLLVVAAGSCFIYVLVSTIYTLYFHPLAKFPGPKLWAVSKIPSVYSLVTGNLPFDIAAIHDEYGDYVRTSPSSISITHPDVWKDVNGYKSGQPQFVKDPVQYIAPPNGVRSIHSALDDKDHARQRRLLAHAFSEKSLREQEGLIQSYVDKMIDAFREQIKGPAQGKVDMVRWLNYTTFDLIGDLTFGESFHCLDDGEYHPWVALIFEYMRGAMFLIGVRQFPFLNVIFEALLPKKVMDMRNDHFKLSAKRMDKRLAQETERPDFVQAIIKNAKQDINVSEMHSNSEILIIAGSETTATALSGAFYYLCLNPSMMKTLVDEIRSIPSAADLTIKNILELKYMAAVVDEAMRIYPPVPGDLPRQAPQEGIFVGGRWIPGNTRTSVVQWAICHSKTNFRNPEVFAPQRWIPGNKEYAEDSLQAVQAFSTGPRNCIGKNLAWAEMRLLLTNILWNFDVEICDESRNWTDQRVYALWEKIPLMLKLTERKV